MHLNQYIHTHILTHLPSISSSPNKFQKQRKLTDMEASPTIGVYPLHRSKIIHLVRHAEGIHNAAGEEDYSAYSSEEYADAHITPLGWQQVDALRKHVKATGLSKRVELVVVSPLLRTLQTAVGAFGGEEYTNGVDVPPLMVANAGNSGRPAVSSLNCPSFLAVELCREIIVDHPCDRRRSVTEYQALFPSIDFSLIESDRDFLWKPGQRESVQEAAARGVKFINWLWTRKETEIVVVSHRGFLRALLSSFGNDCHTDTKKEMSTRFVNCELRSIAIIDRGMIGTGSSTTNYPGKTPQGLGLASDDVAEEKMDKENALNNTS
ncbi:PREDICTED: phosphoglycerate mutase-like protein [Tarenaya hassleriana]|uniref:phosphoglycerate mutase-like protein n=1 Tax=Tarenaya hassleriana TaxID=28532 RepID=UPI00053C85BE|nr:PREDICTED: phosphoglycerate mutase-like protein [Tarenaya hassleriana]